MKIYNIRLYIKDDMIHEEFIRTNLNESEITESFKPPYAEIKIKEVNDFIPTLESPAKEESLQAEKEFIDFSIEREVSEIDSSGIAELTTNYRKAKSDYSNKLTEIKNKYFNISSKSLSDIETTMSPPYKKVVFSGHIKAYDLKSL